MLRVTQNQFSVIRAALGAGGRPKSRFLSAFVWLASLCALLILGVGCSTPKPSARKQAYNTRAFESELKRGVSTRSDVERVLGKPNGSGALWFPTTTAAEDTWFYQTIHADAASGKIDVQVDMVLVFFKGDLLDGFIWFSDADNTWSAED